MLLAKTDQEKWANDLHTSKAGYHKPSLAEWLQSSLNHSDRDEDQSCNPNASKYHYARIEFQQRNFDE